jgi:hypothetical protein
LKRGVVAVAVVLVDGVRLQLLVLVALLEVVDRIRKDYLKPLI